MANKSEVFIGAVFGRLTVVSEPFRVVNLSLNHSLYANCACACGSGVKRRSIQSLGTQSNSCGCLSAEKWVRSDSTSKADSPEYKSWHSMWESTTNSKHKNYETAKFRVPPHQWRVFENFLADMGPRPDGTALARKDTRLGFSPGNCIWATPAVQAKNQSDNIFLTHDKHGVMTLKDAVNLRANGKPIPSRYKGKPLAFVFLEPGWDFSTYKQFLTKGTSK